MFVSSKLKENGLLNQSNEFIHQTKISNNNIL